MPSFLQKVRSLAPARADLKPDLVAGLTFAVVAVPQAMGHALLATVNPVMGIFTLMVAVPVAAVTTGSVFMNVSTTAATAVAAGAELADIAPGDRLAALAALVLLVGVIQLLAGVLRAGIDPALRLRPGHDRLPERRGGAHHPGPARGADRLPEHASRTPWRGPSTSSCA